jgi:hypothetical protein
VVRDAKRLRASRAFRIGGYVSVGVLIIGAVLAAVLMFQGGTYE